MFNWLHNSYVAFLENGFGEKHNIIVVDWGALSTPRNQNQTSLGGRPLNSLSQNPFYQAAVRNVPKVGKRLAEFIDFLMVENYLDSPTDVYLIGFSLGAQVSGTCGYEVKRNFSEPLGRITGNKTYEIFSFFFIINIPFILAW